MPAVRRGGRAGARAGVVLGVVALVAAVVVAGAVRGPAPTALADGAPTAVPGEVSALQESYRRAAAAIGPSVVHLYTERTVRMPGALHGHGEAEGERPAGDDFFRPRAPGAPPGEREVKQKGLGSGVIVDEAGHVLTNNHLVALADELRVHLSDGRECAARVVGTDPQTDLAVIRLDGEGFTPAVFGDSDLLEVGDFVLAAGNPFGLEQTITSGIVSAKGRANVGVADYEDFIQTDAAINPGNSGGPLVNLRGEVIGINTAITSRTGGYQGIGFAVPANMARVVFEGILEEGRVIRGYLGVSIQNLTPEAARSLGLERTAGAAVVGVSPRSPAAEAGVEVGEAIVRFGDRPVRDVYALRVLVANARPGTRVDLEIAGCGGARRVAVEIGELPRDAARASARAARGRERERERERDKDRSSAGEVDLGLAVGVLTPEVRGRYGISESERGLVVLRVAPEGLAARGGVREGTVLREVDGEPMTDLDAYEEAIEGLDIDRGVRLVLREGRGTRVVLIKRG